MRVGLAKGNDRKANILRALELIKDDLSVDKPILIKPNFVSIREQLAATHRDAVRAVLEFLDGLGYKDFMIGEAPAGAPASAGYQNFGYYELRREFKVDFVDLHQDESVKLKIFDRDFKPLEVRVAKTPFKCFRISITRMKTHDTTIVTLGIKNMVVGCIQGDDKGLLHQGYAQINLSIAGLARHLLPHLTVIDGFVGMEGMGPVFGTAIAPRVALAGTDAVAVDSLAAHLMGFDPDEVGYLYYCKELGIGEGNLLRIEVLGNPIEECRMSFTPHYTYPQQLKWKVSDWRKLLKELGN